MNSIRTCVIGSQVAALTKAFVSSRSYPESVSQAELREHKTEVKANIEKQESKVLHAIEGLRHEVLDFRKDMDKELALLKKEMLIQLGRMIVGAVAIIIGAIKYLP